MLKIDDGFEQSDPSRLVPTEFSLGRFEVLSLLSLVFPLGMDPATRRQRTPVEIRDDLEWSLNEYTKAMDRYRLKRSVGLLEAHVIPTVELLSEDEATALQ